MSHKCSICQHKNRLDIDRQLANGGALTVLARKYSLGIHSLARHRDNHLSRQLVRSVKLQEENNGMDILKDMNSLIDRTEKILSSAEEKKNSGVALKAIKELRANYELLAKVVSYLHESKSEKQSLDRNIIELELQEESLKNLNEKLSILSDAERSTLKMMNIKILVQDKTINCLRPALYAADLSTSKAKPTTPTTKAPKTEKTSYKQPQKQDHAPTGWTGALLQEEIPYTRHPLRSK